MHLALNYYFIQVLGLHKSVELHKGWNSNYEDILPPKYYT